MSRNKKTVIIIVSVVVVIFISITAVLWMLGGELFFMAPGYNKMERFLKTNFAELSYVADALFKLEYDSIAIDRNPLREKDKYCMRVSREYLIYETVPIPDELVGHIKNLYENGVRYISCGRDFVGFSNWAFMDEIRDVTYSRTGKKPDGNQLIKVKQLSKENWYYCVDNYEKAKALNLELFQ